MPPRRRKNNNQAKEKEEQERILREKEEEERRNLEANYNPEEIAEYDRLRKAMHSVLGWPIS